MSMSKRFRLLLLLVLLGIAFYFLYPSIQWYFLLSPQVKELALMFMDLMHPIWSDNI